ncbi:AraC family transcriptional regulator [Ideonella dechloratans]|uniref:AraC family transcriptional regulator n=1 Tax=Ideonella dechloratans TaxID=36863 RepID=UPI0035B0C534
MRRLHLLLGTALLALGLSLSARAQTPPADAASAAPAPAPAASASAPLPSDAALDARAEDLKREVITLNRDLLALEEELLYPASTQVNVFVSMDVGKLFMLESVQVKVDDKLVAQHLYTPAEVKALHRGGVQRLYVGNLRSGPHEITAFFTGQGPHERDYKRGTTLQFDKGSETRNIELKVRDALGKLQPEFDVKVWP